MKKLSLQDLNLDENQMLSKEEKKKIAGGGGDEGCGEEWVDCGGGNCCMEI